MVDAPSVVERTRGCRLMNSGLIERIANGLWENLQLFFGEQDFLWWNSIESGGGNESVLDFVPVAV